MIFNSTEYILFFLPITFLFYFYLTSKRLILGAKVWLIATSLFFYSFWKISYLPIILASIFINFTLGSTIAKDTIGVRVNKKIVLIIGLLFNIGLLMYYKYSDFLIFNVNELTGSKYDLLNLTMPLAISFFTFQQIAYLVDSYKGHTKEYDFLSYCLFVTFFPQLIAGPIVHHKELIPQFMQAQNFARSYKNIVSGIFIFLIGLFKKVVIADSFAVFATRGFDQAESLNIVSAWFSSLSYTVQIYYDFSGYCDMAIGSALMFNIKLPINFNSPYKAQNIQDFWHRWHITLSKFLSDYIYVPLGGNRVSPLRNYFNLFIVFVIGGFWHGASWMFIIWGTLHGVAIVIHRMWKKLGLHMNKYLGWFITFNFVNIAWVFFRAKDMTSAKKVLTGMVDFSSLNQFESFKFKEVLKAVEGRSRDVLLIILVIISALVLQNSSQWLEKVKIQNSALAYTYGISFSFVFIFLMAKMIIVPYSEFIYFNF